MPNDQPPSRAAAARTVTDADAAFLRNTALLTKNLGGAFPSAAAARLRSSSSTTSPAARGRTEAISRAMNPGKQRQRARDLRKHLPKAADQLLETLPEERRMVVLLTLLDRIDQARRSAEERYESLLVEYDAAVRAAAGATTAMANDDDEEQAIAAGESSSRVAVLATVRDECKREVELTDRERLLAPGRPRVSETASSTEQQRLPPLVASMVAHVERQQELSRAYEKNRRADRNARLLALAITFGILLFVVGLGTWLSQSRNLYHATASVYRLWDRLSGGNRHGTLGQRNHAEEYQYYE